MSCAERLRIRGIRSYSAKEDEQIVFAKPLTLIVGANGSGKTVRGGHARKRVRRGQLPHAMHSSFHVRAMCENE